MDFMDENSTFDDSPVGGETGDDNATTAPSSPAPISWTVPGAPVGKPRPRFDAHTGRVYTPVEGKLYEQAIGIAAAAAMRRAGQQQIAAGPVEMECWIYQQPPVKWNEQRRADALAHRGMHPAPTVVPDADNILKSIMDGSNGVVYRDDRQCTDIIVRRRWSEVDGVFVRVRPVDATSVHFQARHED